MLSSAEERGSHDSRYTMLSSAEERGSHDSRYTMLSSDEESTALFSHAPHYSP
jgi:hypothetical protein